MGTKATSAVTFNPVLDVQPVTNVNITLPSNTVQTEQEPPIPTIPATTVENLFNSLSQALAPAPASAVPVSDPIPAAHGPRAQATEGFFGLNPTFLLGGVVLIFVILKGRR